MQEELRPCPFCRGRAVVVKGYLKGVVERFSVVCGVCFSATPWRFDMDEAINTWNKRANEIGLADELRILENFIACMPKTYRIRNTNSAVVHDILMRGTSTAGQTSCFEKCRELGIEPDGYTLAKAAETKEDI